MLKVGVIGVGAMGQHHARVYAEMNDVELVGICDINKKLADELAKKHNTKSYEDYHDILNDVDAVSIVVPTTHHKKIAMEVMDMGIDVLIEKPIADTLENADEIIKKSEATGTKLMIGHIERFNPAIQALKKIVDKGDSGVLGDIVTLSVTRVGPYNPRIRDVGIIIDLGVHDIDLMSYLYADNVKSVFASAGKVIHPFEDHAAIMLNFDNDRTGVIKTNWLTPHKVRTLTATGTRGIGYVNYIDSTLQVCDKEWIRDKKIEKKEPLASELEHFIECVKNNKNPEVSGRAGRHAIEVALACVQSYETGSCINLK
ncbi:MAG: oxidoreductase [Candidatus Altiarchaeales archaeon HGW-Altiarchaeales-3]|nr:MAG: oxidoreductase [Candidatus Altiarchaeales archaeon HGW-Altiarchaeales-3]